MVNLANRTYEVFVPEVAVDPEFVAVEEARAALMEALRTVQA